VARNGGPASPSLLPRLREGDQHVHRATRRRAAHRRADYNAAFLFDVRGDPLQRYVKRQLVPFSEWLPWRFLRIMEINFGQADFTPGRRATPLRCGGHAAGVLICIEAIFPQLARATVREGADLLVNITNDVWFGDTAAPYEHAAMARTRAVELRRPLVRCANTGVSMIVDRAGRVSRRLGMSERGEIRALVHPERTMTLYARFGDWVVAVAAFVLLTALFRSVRRARLRAHTLGRILARRR
jgi:apolipoprotein N-acyltransferase